MPFLPEEDDLAEHFPIANSIDNAILMHRDAHFGGQFDIMLDYYKKNGKGVFPDFQIDRIEKLALLEEQLKQNLAGLLLTGSEAERVADAKKAYKQLRDLYEDPKHKGTNALLVADLILSEEEAPQNEIDAIVAKKEEIVPALIQLLRSEDFHSPLFPGYGTAPTLAARCLGFIGDKRSIISLFESIGISDFFDDDISLMALRDIGEPAKEFLLKVLHGRPLNEDNEKAAIALIAFKDDPDVALACLNMLLDREVRQDPVLSTYLVLACEGLKGSKHRKRLAALLDDLHTPKSLYQDIKTILNIWEQS